MNLIKRIAGKAKRLLAVIFASSFLAQSGCAYTDKEKYMNFLADLDIISRIDQCIDDVETGKTDYYTRGELETLREDIASFGYYYEDGERANNLLDLTIDELLNGMDNYADGDYADYKLNKTRAHEYYAQANAQISAIRDGAENV